jgi:hypothetical protein
LPWLLLVYKVPSEPSARRVYVWRKLKRLGAILLHDAVWVLPHTDYTQEQFQWLAVEIGEMGGEALVWSATQVLAIQEDSLHQQFLALVDASYQEILTVLEDVEADINALAKQYQQTKRQDYFHSPLGDVVKQKLVERRGQNTL